MCKLAGPDVQPGQLESSILQQVSVERGIEMEVRVVNRSGIKI